MLPKAHFRRGETILFTPIFYPKKFQKGRLVMNIGFICKYPPTAGGEAAKAFWLTRALAGRGHTVHVITNGNEVEDSYRQRMVLDDYSFFNLPNLKVHSTPENGLPAYIPMGNPFEIKLASIGLLLAKKEQLELIDSWYLVPNAVAAFMVVSAINRKLPWAIRHAGSDLSRLLPHVLFEPLLRQVLLKADKVVTYRSSKDFLLGYGVEEERLWLNDKVSVDTEFFSPDGPVAEELPKDKPIILSIGKIAPVKGTFDLLRSFAPFKNEACLVFVTGGPRLDFLEKEIKTLDMEKAVKIFPPVPPWKIPFYLRAATVVVHAERDFPIAIHRPISVREGLACGCCMLLSEEMFGKYHFLKREENVLTVDPHNHDQFSTRLMFILNNQKTVNYIGQRARETSLEIEDFDSYVDATVELYESMIK